MPIVRTTIFTLLGLITLLSMAHAQMESESTRMELLPGQAVIKAGDTLQFAAIVYTDFDTVCTPDRLKWSVSGGQIDNEGKYTAPQEPGVYEIAVKYKHFHARARVEVRIFLPKIARIEIITANPTMEIGHSCQFQAFGYDRRNRPVPFVPTWSATGGNINANGNYLATMAGDFFITAQDPKSGISGRAAVRVMPPMIVRIDVTPANSAVDLGKSYQFQAIGYDRRNRPVPIAPTWSTTGGSISNTGLYSATMPGQYVITAQDPRSNLFGRATVTVKALATRLDVAPASAMMRGGQSLQLSAVAYDRFGRPVPCAITWSASGGQVTVTGLYTAGYTPGNYQVVAQDGSSGLQASAVIQILGEPQPQPQPGNGRIVVTNWDAGGGNFFSPTAKISAEVYGSGITMAKLYTVSKNGGLNELQARSCKDGDKIEFKAKYDRFNVVALEIQLYDNAGNVVARSRKAVS